MYHYAFSNYEPSALCMIYTQKSICSKPVGGSNLSLRDSLCSRGQSRYPFNRLCDGRGIGCQVPRAGADVARSDRHKTGWPDGWGISLMYRWLLLCPTGVRRFGQQTPPDPILLFVFPYLCNLLFQRVLLRQMSFLFHNFSNCPRVSFKSLPHFSRYPRSCSPPPDLYRPTLYMSGPLPCLKSRRRLISLTLAGPAGPRVG